MSTLHLLLFGLSLTSSVASNSQNVSDVTDVRDDVTGSESHLNYSRLLREMEELRKTVTMNDAVHSRTAFQKSYEVLAQQVWEMKLQLSALQTQMDMVALRSQLDALRSKVNMMTSQPEMGRESGREASLADDRPGEKQGDKALDAFSEPRVAGSVYVRWGSKTCSNDTQTLYSGIIGGSHQTLSGAAANALCLPLNPEFGDKPAPASYAGLYGGEYEVREESNKHDLDPECAVCEIPRPVTIMMPAAKTCLSGWTMEYTGYLMAGHGGHSAATEFICMDEKKDGRIGSKADRDGKLFYYTLAVCGSLPCPPYEEKKVIVCVVCSK